MNIIQLTEGDAKQRAARAVLEALPEWFGIPEAREQYIRESAEQLFFCAQEDGQPIGFLASSRPARPRWSWR